MRCDEVPCGNRTRLSGVEGRCLSRSAKGTRSCGGRNRTCEMTFNRRPPDTNTGTTAITMSAWSDLNRRSPVPETGGFPNFPTHRKTKSTRRELNPHLRRGIAVRCRYITGAQKKTCRIVKDHIARKSEHREGFEPSSLHYGCRVVAAGPPVHFVLSIVLSQWDQKDLNLHSPG
jgi:hypothetical protein